MTERIIKKSELIKEMKNKGRQGLYSVLCPAYVASNFGRDSDRIARYPKCDMGEGATLCDQCSIYREFKNYRKDQFNECIPLIKQVLFENDIKVVDL